MVPRKRKTVLVQVNSLGLGGTQLNAVDLALAVRDHGYDSVVFGPSRSLPTGRSLIDVGAERGVEVRSYNVRPSVLAGGARELAVRARSVGASVVHIYGTWAGARSAFWGACLLARRPLVHTVYEMAVSPQTYRHTALIVGTAYLRDSLTDRPGFTRLVSPPVDTDRDAEGAIDAAAFLHSIGSDLNQVRIGLVSRLDEDMKALSVETAINAVRLLDDPRLRLVVAGDGDAYGRLRQLVDHVNRDAGRDVASLVGAMWDPRPVYASSEVVLGMGGSAARALAFGKPLVVQGQFGTSEVFNEDTANDLYSRSFWNDRPSDDPARELAANLKTLLDDAERRGQIGRFARSFAKQNFSLSAMAERLAETYRVAELSYRVRDWAADLPLELRALTRRSPFESREPRFWARARRLDTP